MGRISFLITVFAFAAINTNAENVATPDGCAGPNCSLNTPAPDSPEACLKDCQDYWQKNPDAKPANTAGICTDHWAIKTLNVVATINTPEGALGCGEGVWKGILGVPETVVGYAAMVGNVGEFLRKGAERTSEFIKKCDADLQCRIALGRQLVQFRERGPDGKFIRPDSDVAVEVKPDVIDIYSLLSKVEVAKEQIQYYCGNIVQEVIVAHAESGAPVSGFEADMARYKAVAAKDVGCLGTMNMKLPKPEDYKQQGPAKGFLESLGIKLHCYQSKEMIELACLGVAKVVLDPLNLIPAGFAAGVAIKAGLKARAAVALADSAVSAAEVGAVEAAQDAASMGIRSLGDNAVNAAEVGAVDAAKGLGAAARLSDSQLAQVDDMARAMHEDFIRTSNPKVTDAAGNVIGEKPRWRAVKGDGPDGKVISGSKAEVEAYLAQYFKDHPELEGFKDKFQIVQNGDKWELQADIANLPFDKLPASFSASNRALAQQYLAANERLASAQVTPQSVEQTASEYHDIWMANNEYRRGSNPELFKPYDQLTPSEQLKDLEIMESTLRQTNPEIVNSVAFQQYKNEVGRAAFVEKGGVQAGIKVQELRAAVGAERVDHVLDSVRTASPELQQKFLNKMAGNTDAQNQRLVEAVERATNTCAIK